MLIIIDVDEYDGEMIMQKILKDETNSLGKKYYKYCSLYGLSFKIL